MPRLIDQEHMEACVARVLSGEKALVVSKDAQIPYSTLMRYVGRRRPSPTAISVSPSTSSSNSELASTPYTLEGETLVFEWMKREQAAGRRLNRQLVLAHAAEALGLRPGASATWWFRRFRHRRPEVVGPAAKLSVVLSVAPTTAARGCQETASDAREHPPPPPLVTSDESSSCARCSSSAATLDAVERAVRLLQAEYAQKLEAAELAEAFDVVVRPCYARAFASMAPSPARDIWLYKQIRQLQGGFQESDGDHSESAAHRRQSRAEA